MSIATLIMQHFTQFNEHFLFSNSNMEMVSRSRMNYIKRRAKECRHQFFFVRPTTFCQPRSSFTFRSGFSFHWLLFAMNYQELAECENWNCVNYVRCHQLPLKSQRTYSRLTTKTCFCHSFASETRACATHKSDDNERTVKIAFYLKHSMSLYISCPFV